MFVLTVPEVSWLGRLTMPVMIGAPRLRRQRRYPEATVTSVIVDSGAYRQLHDHGHWTIPARQYADELADWTQRLPVAWAAPQDWPCEPAALAATGHDVDWHQKATTASVLELQSLGAPVVPVLQGWTATDYVAHIEQYRAEGVALDGIVGMGSTCRQRRDIGPELRLVAMAGIRPHAFGVKGDTWAKHRGLLASADSMAWSSAARRRNIRMMGCTHHDCRNCWRWAATWWEAHR